MNSTLNEFAAKKLGEVLAFNRLGTETLEKGRDALLPVLSPEKVADMEEKNRLHAQGIEQIATDAGVIDITRAKTEKTLEKLRKMRDLYIGDQWHNATEILEWSGFFEGATIVHWALIRGVAEGTNNEELLTFAEEGIAWHYELLEMCESELSEEGADKGTS
jgi:hypothetical protein